MMGDYTYNGWANRETWAFYLHLGNDQGLWEWAEERTREFAKVSTYSGEVIPSLIGSQMVEAVEELWDECRDAEWVRLMISDVGSVWRVDTYEVGRHLLDDFVPGWDNGDEDEDADMWIELSKWAADSGFTLLDDGDYQNDDTGDIWMREDLYAYMVEVTA